jgi:L-asparaginase / beta-aspartyl-peptidase
MKRVDKPGLRIGRFLLVILFFGGFFMGIDARAQSEPAAGIAIAVHGGAGTILRDQMTQETEQAYRDKMTEALRSGYEVLRQGGSSLDAVTAAIVILEDSPLFNAGHGAVLTSEGTVELDASIMDGSDRSAGAVAGLQHIRNPIRLARLVMEQSPHVIMAGNGAEQFAQELGMDLVPNEYFLTPRRREQLEQIQRQQQDSPTGSLLPPDEQKFGTVGAVALDRNGNLAAGTSTGGTANKRFGRIGDSPIIGAGTYADNETCAVSSTGHGEFFIRGVVAYDIAAMMRYGGLSLDEAANAVIQGRLTAMGGTGGVIAMDRQGNIAMPFNTPGMYRGYIDRDGDLSIQIFRDGE